MNMDKINFDKIYKIYQDIDSMRKSNAYDYKKLKSLWKKFFTMALKDGFDFNKESINVLFDWGSGGHNWIELHPTDEYNKLSKKKKFDKFCHEIFYISDRLSIDRIFRTHWMFNQLTEKDYRKTFKY